MSQVSNLLKQADCRWRKESPSHLFRIADNGLLGSDLMCPQSRSFVIPYRRRDGADIPIIPFWGNYASRA
jgi:hypothetical protein